MKTVLNSIFKFIVATSLIVWMIYNGMLDLSSLSIFSNPTFLLISVFLVLFQIVMNNLRWAFLLKMQNFRFSTKQTLRLTLIGLFFNYAIPGGVGGDIVKGYYLLKNIPKKKALATTTLFLDRIIGLYGMALVSTTVLLVTYRTILNRPELYVLAYSVIGLFFLITVFFILSFSVSFKNLHFVNFVFNKVPGGSIIQKIYEAIHSYRKNPKVLFQTLIYSFLSQFAIIIFVWFFAKITDAPDVSFSVYLFIVPLGMISMALPITPAGIGVGQTAMYYLYALYTGINNQIGPNAFTAYQVILFSWGLLGAYYYVSEKKLYPTNHATN